MAFKFSLEALLKKNKYAEDLAKKSYAEAMGELTLTIQKIKEQEKNIVDTRDDMARTQSQGGLVLSQLEYCTGYIKGAQQKIANLQVVAREQMEVVEDRKRAMIAARQEYKKIEVLRDKRLKEYRLKEKKKAEKRLDDIIIMRNRK
ncbi:MAG: flagellar export protein FliJ [Bdellovibrionaceae bacterium]|nr:flagellar export protein FliJ [Pseudobdellovibrionaceae bacterium]|tara:strand:- start:18873 stop:19310 length:438 start_codon:yes stop_codon:yes gene_type:complete